MSQGAERCRQERWGAEVFLRAMEQGKTRLARFVLEALDGSIVGMKTELGRSPLMRAVLLPDPGHRLKFVQLLLLLLGVDRAEVNGRDQHGRTALSHACEGGSVEVVQLLVQSNADPEIVDIWGNSALIYAALAGRTLVVEFLVRSFKRLGMDINRTNSVGNSAIQVAKHLGHRDCVRILESHGRKWSAGEASNGGPLEGITFKRSPYGQNRGPSLCRGRERRPQELLQVSNGKDQQVLGYKVPVGKCQSHKQLLYNDGPPSSSCDDSHNDFLNLNSFPKSFEQFSDIDQEYGDVCDLFQLIEPPVGWEQENSSHGLKEKGQLFNSPWVATGIKISSDCNGLLETQRPKISGVNGANIHPVLLRKVKGSLPPSPTLPKGCRGVKVNEKLSGGCSENPRDIKPLDKNAQNQPIHGEQDSDTCKQGPLAWSQCWVKGQDKIFGCLDGLLASTHRDNSIRMPVVGKQGEPGSFVPQVNQKEIHNMTSSSNCFREDTSHPIAAGNRKRPSHGYIGSMGNTEGQRRALKKPSTLESELKMRLKYVQTGISNSESVVSLPPVDSPCPDARTAPASTSVPFPGDIDSMLSEKCGPNDEVLEKILKLSDCELEGLQVVDDVHHKKRCSWSNGSCASQRVAENPMHPPPVPCKPPTVAFSMLRLFRRFTVPQLKTHTEDQEGFMGRAAGSVDDGRKLYRSETFPNSGNLSRSAGKPASAGSKVNSTSTRTTDEPWQH